MNSMNTVIHPSYAADKVRNLLKGYHDPIGISLTVVHAPVGILLRRRFR
jgi:hypothetical protein